MEISPSGRGVKIWVRAHLDGPGKRVVYEDGAVEVYDRGRYFTVTGQTLNGAPLQVAEHQTEISTFEASASSSVSARGTGPIRTRRGALSRKSASRANTLPAWGGLCIWHTDNGPATRGR